MGAILIKGNVPLLLNINNNREQLKFSYRRGEDVNSVIAMDCPPNAVYGQGYIQNTDWPYC